MRLFYAVELDEGTRNILAQKQAKLKSRALKANFTRSGNLHLTLRFMGEVEDAYLPVLKKILEAAASKCKAFHLKMSSPGVFERGHKSIVWWGIDPNEELYRLQAILEEEIRLNGFPAETKPYRPHITLAREFVSNGDIKGIIGELKPLDHTFQVSGISLMESCRVDGKLTYLSVCKAPLITY